MIIEPLRDRGIIPARAGSTERHLVCHQRRRDHPRSRGVYDTWTGSTPDGGGSSPLARGLRARGIVGHVCARIIPARAGFTDDLLVVQGDREDHPRSRGVYDELTARGAIVEGSSPLARGLQPCGCGAGVSLGIIPARAGFTHRPLPAKRVRVDHPRSRGVYCVFISSVFVLVGSSPLARGLRSHPSGTCGTAGIIPARAGFTPSDSRPRPGGPDHPRSRGVYSMIDLINDMPEGSSPLARGLRDPRRRDRAGEGIIPARAGFTRSPVSARGCWGDHPRSRGVYTEGGDVSRAKMGSSPLARGLRQHVYG